MIIQGDMVKKTLRGYLILQIILLVVAIMSIFTSYDFSVVIAAIAGANIELILKNIKNV